MDHSAAARYQSAADVVEALLDRVDDLERVLAVAHDHDAADHLALTVEVGDPAAVGLGAHDLAEVAD